MSVRHWWDPPVVVRLGGAGVSRNVTSVEDAAACLLQRWPRGPGGPAYQAATRACLAALEGDRAIDDARQAFVDAAEEAGIFLHEGYRR